MGADIGNSSTAASTDGPPDASTFVENQQGFDTVIHITAEKVLALESVSAYPDRFSVPDAFVIDVRRTDRGRLCRAAVRDVEKAC